MPYPKWLTPERKEYLINLWYRIGNCCLEGHPNCPELSHYAYANRKYVKVSIPHDRMLEGVDGVWRKIQLYDIQIGEIVEWVPLRLYDKLSNEAIEDWKSQDRELRRVQWDAECREMHRLPTRMRNNAQFNADDFYANQPEYYLEGFGFSVVRRKPFVKVRIASSFQYLFVELDNGVFRGISQHKKKKILRYGHPLPDKVVKDITDRVNLCVRAYKN